MLLCAPTGAGKTNVALMAILHEMSLHRREDVRFFPSFFPSLFQHDDDDDDDDDSYYYGMIELLVYGLIMSRDLWIRISSKLCT